MIITDLYSSQNHVRSSLIVMFILNILPIILLQEGKSMCITYVFVVVVDDFYVCVRVCVCVCVCVCIRERERERERDFYKAMSCNKEP